MNKSRTTKELSQGLRGLEVTKNGLAGPVVVTTDGFQDALLRHGKVIRLMDECTEIPTGAKVLLALVVNDQVLTMSGLEAATSIRARTYVHEETHCVQLSFPGDWLDRRNVSPQTVEFIEANRGVQVKVSDWKWVAGAVKHLHALSPGENVMDLLLSDARCWWFQRMQGPLFAHAARMVPFQLLSRSAWARLYSGMAQVALTPESSADDSRALNLVQTTFRTSKETAIIEELVTFVGVIARERQSKDEGRAQVLERIDLLLPMAARLGRTQVMVLAGLGHALRVGGVRGFLWSPVTAYEYIRLGLVGLSNALLNSSLDELDGERFHKLYSELLEKIRPSQRGKFAAFLQAFHRFLVICGFDSLPKKLHANVERFPPAAAVVWPHELQLAIEYVDAVAPTPRVSLQARLGLTLGFHIPIRTEELWCIRRCDVHLRNGIYIDICPRQRDGLGKTPSGHLPHDIHDPDLQRLLIDMVALRNEDENDDEDDDTVVLLGQPQQPDVRHEQLLTTQLMNDALRWATGNVTASFYDLRHSVFTMRARAVLESIE